MQYIAIHRIERRPAKAKASEVVNPGDTVDLDEKEADELLALGAVALLADKEENAEKPKPKGGRKKKTPTPTPTPTPAEGSDGDAAKDDDAGATEGSDGDAGATEGSDGDAAKDADIL